MRTLARRPLRVQLSLFMVVLLALGMLVSSLLATASLRGYLLDRVDEELVGASRPFAAFPGRLPDSSQSETDRPRPPNRFFVARLANGTVDVINTPTGGSAPTLPGVDELTENAGTAFEASSADGATWRVLVSPLSTGDGWTVVALPLSDLQATVGRLVLLQAVVGVAVLVIAGGVGFFVVRRSLRPLDEMATAAHEIADGDLSRRVPEVPTSREVEELATSFNMMVTHIERAFAAQQASEAQARESEDRMRRFVADAGHELRTPLTSIRGYAELIEQGAAPDPADAVARIQAEAARMGSLVDDLLQLARMDQQRPLERLPVALGDVARASIDAATVANPDRRVTLTAPVDGPWVLGDETRLRQVVDNLLSNAIRYSPATEPIDVRVETIGPEDARRAQVSVVDRGPGLSADEVAHVFERLYRTDEARTRVTGGSGLGLAIVRSIVLAHAGETYVDSTPGEGSTFGFRVPLAGR
ncbi:MAG: HAMP domain-containing sensor histidine kinase [Candidatus Nanopelagicales bacterium]|jgi:two-component system OmpR family sensor kinase